VNDVGYFHQESAIRRIWRESVVMLGGCQRMLLIEAAHPLVAAAIVQHSSYQTDPWTRLERTLAAYSTVIFGERVEADRVAKRVRSRHRGIHGKLGEQTGPLAEGTAYSAVDPHLLLWVHASAVDTALVMFQSFVGQLEAGDQEAFYEEMKVVARLFGTPSGVIPATLDDFREYQQERLASGDIVVGADAREVARLVLHPPVPVVLRPALAALSRVTIALLPPALRKLYGFRCGLGPRGLATVSRHIAMQALPLLPERARLLWPTNGGSGPSGLVVDAILAFAEGRRSLPYGYKVPAMVSE
jgi:uncharacterized protein (DUF2236 family)